MKNENVVLTVCLIVAFIAIGGLTVTGCRSTKAQRIIHEQVDSFGKSNSLRTVDNDSLLRLLKINKWALNYHVEDYVPVIDSARHVIGTVLVRKESVRIIHEESRDSVTEIKNREVDKREEESVVKRDLQEKVNEETKTRASPMLVIGGLLGCILLAMFLWKNIISRFFN